MIKLRGVVLQQVDGAWINLERGGVVPDDRTIRTLANARLELRRDEETLELGPDTQISIDDQQRFTTVTQTFGELIVDAEARSVEHFAVQTPYLGVVVKGARFTVTTDNKGASVKVGRGEVAVEDVATHLSAIVTAGQSATSGTDQSLVVLSASGSVISGVLEGTADAAGDVVDDVLGDDGVVGGVLDGVGDALGSGSSKNDDEGDQGSGGLGVNVDVPGIDIHL